MSCALYRQCCGHHFPLLTSIISNIGRGSCIGSALQRDQLGIIIRQEIQKKQMDTVWEPLQTGPVYTSTA